MTRESPSLAGDGNLSHDASMEARIVQLETIIPTLATKADVESLRADLNKSAGELLADLNKSAGELRADLNKSAGELRADFEKAQKENRTWMLATVLALFAGILGVGGFVVSTIKGSYQALPAQSAPIIIQVPAQALQPPPQAAKQP
ncbi:hypothetical protein OK116_06265 [Xylella fastidiosa subsp. fastidiosa]|uniref:Uncharacterized protein n=2 Tax=Xylella fastidiosa TaxID=2371 RepID=Q87CE9_XYLFT|nr:hypothetical protein [Xylella fastidiosa]KAF0570666.1 hypothetical protein P305_09040 [Xylella fastidiosa subsp. fastidiosa Mus-1]AAO28981.1 conserved hypothetical protein [Xylella fastidiosa Temecula1]MDC7962212.1 hypothetical protein [Xylella fastidiosa]UIT49153.1 hypothetical protein LZ752_06060 [Xylella fastidiosa subsp. fastidiosa]UIT51300.1 hypothetical protein LZ753_05970 [Xylella fastidiosa subsp. fastidiosa]